MSKSIGSETIGAPVGIVTEVRPPNVSGLPPSGWMAAAAGGRGHVGREDRQGLRPEGIGEPDTQPLPAQGDVDDLAERGVGEARFGRHVGRLGQLGRGRPGPDPAALVAPAPAAAGGDEGQGQEGRRAGASDAAHRRRTPALTARSSPGRP